MTTDSMYEVEDAELNMERSEWFKTARFLRSGYTVRKLSNIPVEPVMLDEDRWREWKKTAEKMSKK